MFAKLGRVFWTEADVRFCWYCWPPFSFSAVFICFPHWIVHLGLLAGVKQICSVFLTLFRLQIDEAYPTLYNNPLYCRAAYVWTSQELMCTGVEMEEWQQDGCHPPGEKMSGITAFSTQLTPKTDGASDHCGAAPTETMATARQHEACRANCREERSTV